MALATYSDLVTSVGKWLARDTDTDLSAMIPDFIALCEARFNRMLRLRTMEHRITGTVADEFIALPTDYLEMRVFQLNTDPITKLEYVSPEWMAANIIQNSPGKPRWFTILDDEIQLGPAPDATYDAEMVYWKRIPALTASATTNWLLTNAPDVYLFGTLAEAAAYLMNVEANAAYNTRYEQAVRNLQGSDEKGKWSGAMMQTRPVGITIG